jgi:hypothetical protein
MTDDIFEPPAIPLCSKTLVATLKRRLREAIDTGKASEAKLFLDIIDRLAKMDWLDDASPQERMDAENAKTASKIAYVDGLIAHYLTEQESEKAIETDKAL